MSIMLHQVSFSNSKLIYSLRYTIPCFMWTSDEEVRKAQQFVPILCTFYYYSLLLFIYLEIDCLHGLKVREYLHSSVFQLRAKS